MVEPKSSAVPGDLGAFADEPKDANAPEPRPKAEDAPVVGEATLVVVKGAMALKGLGFPWEEVSPTNRLAEENVRGESDFALSLLPLAFEVERESLLELTKHKSVLQLPKVHVSLLGATLPEILHKC